MVWTWSFRGIEHYCTTYLLSYVYLRHFPSCPLWPLPGMSYSQHARQSKRQYSFQFAGAYQMSWWRQNFDTHFNSTRFSKLDAVLSWRYEIVCRSILLPSLYASVFFELLSVCSSPRYWCLCLLRQITILQLQFTFRHFGGLRFCAFTFDDTWHT